jgi:hypothetical protein
MAVYIDADKMLANICAECVCVDTNECKNGYCNEREWINNTLVEDVQPVVHGEWSDSYPYRCSVCNSKAPYEYDAHDNDVIMIKSNYCPRCGARMAKV